MSGLDLSRPLLAAGASAKNDWASASADTGLDFTGRAQFKRGVNAEIGLAAMAATDANLSKFVSATAHGNAFAKATAGLQIQLPLNVFDKFGATVGAQAVAEAAAGIEVGLGISVADFIALVQQDGSAFGVPLEILLMLLDEVDVEARVEVAAAAAAMAYISVELAGAVISKPGRKAGFNVRASGGVGLAAGVGFSASAGANFKNFRRFYGRATDRVVDETLKSVRAMLPGDVAAGVAPALAALAPVVKTALRTAYEVGDYIARNLPANTGKDAGDLANQCVGMVLEEAQRFVFGRMVNAGLSELGTTINALHSLGSTWDRLLPQRQRLADALYQMPAEPFQPTSDNVTYWGGLLEAILTLVARLPVKSGGDFDQALAIIYSAAELLIEATESKLNEAQAYAVAIGAGAVRTALSFGGAVKRPPPPRVRSFILTSIGQADRSLDYSDLLVFLTDDVAIALLRRALPEIDTYLGIFKSSIAATEEQVLRLLLTQHHAFLTASSGLAGEADPQRTLEILVDALDSFLDDTITTKVAPEVNRHITDPNVRLYFNEVVLGTVLYAKEVAFQTVLNWQRKPVSNDSFQEALACVVTMLVGRTLVLFADGFMTAVQNDMARACEHAAASISGSNSPLRVLGLPDDPAMTALAGTVIRGGGTLFGPLPDATRSRIRAILYEIMATLPPGKVVDFVAELEDEFFIPNLVHLNELSSELLAIAAKRFETFAGQMFDAAGAVVGNILDTFLGATQQLIANWEHRLDAALHAVQSELTQILRDVQRLAAMVDALFHLALAGLQGLLDTLASAPLRAKLRAHISDRVAAAAVGRMRTDPLYRNLPLNELKDTIESLIRQAVDGLIEGPLVDPVFNALSAVGTASSDLLGDIGDLDPHRPLAGQLLNLVLDSVEDALTDVFGSNEPEIRVSATLSFNFFGPQSVTFDLGPIGVPLRDVFLALNSAVNALDFYKTALDQAATALASAFAAQVELDAARQRHSDAQARQQRFAALHADQAPASRTITIITPRPQATYDRDVEASIHLGGVPASFLGLGQDEQQRVFIFLNGVLLSTKSVALGETIGTVRPSAHPLPPTLPPGGIASASGRIGPNAASSSIGSTSIVDSRNPTIVPRAGRQARPSKKAIEQSMGSGINITVILPLPELAQGTNVLTIALLDVGNTRLVQTLAFAAAAPPKTRVPGTARLPRPAGRRVRTAAPQIFATPLPTASTVAAAFAQAQRHVKAQAKLNLITPRKHKCRGTLTGS